MEKTIQGFIFRLILKGHKVWSKTDRRFHTTFNDQKYVVFYAGNGTTEYYIAKVESHISGSKFLGTPIPIEKFNI